MNRKLVWISGAALCASVGLIACGDDDDGGPGADAGGDASEDAGTGGESGTGGAEGSGGTSGSGGSSTGGSSTGGAGATDAGDAGVDGAGEADAPPDAPVDDLSDLPAPSGVLVAAATSFGDGTTEIAAIDLGTNSRIASFVVQDTDAVPRASGGRGFVLERTNDVLHILDGVGASAHAVSLREGDAGAGSPNPHDVVLFNSGGGSPKAYVSLYDESAIAVVEVDSGTVLGRIDLSAFDDPSDADGSVDAEAGFYDATTGRLYFALQRADLTTASDDTSYMPRCADRKSLLVAVDPNTDTIVGFGDAGPASAVELTLAGPAAVAYDAAEGRLLLLNQGCFDGGDAGPGARARHGIEAVTLATGTTEVLYAADNANFLARLIPLASDTLVVESLEPEFFETQHQPWQIGAASLGALLSNVPGNPVSDTAESLIGIDFAGPSGPKGILVRHRVANGATKVLLENVWSGSGNYVAGIARVTP